MAERIWGVTAENSALALSLSGVSPGAWLQSTLGNIWGGIKQGVKLALDLGNRIYEGGKELLAALSRGELGIFLDWFKDDPFGAGAGVAAVAVAGWLIGSATGITAVAVGGAKALWASICGIKLGGIAFGAMLPSLQSVIVGGATTVMNLDWQQSDKSILAELEAVYLTFLNNVGESAGRMLAGFILGGGKANPKLKINISAAVALSIQAEVEGSDIEGELIEELSNLANVFIRYATNLAGKLGYMHFRKWARENVRTGIPAIDNHIKNWGLIEGQSFVINTVIDEKIEAITPQSN